ncbi:MAG: hypothetical protein U1F81_15590 [Verrucomicrobiaceae bacterium]
MRLPQCEWRQRHHHRQKHHQERGERPSHRADHELLRVGWPLQEPWRSSNILLDDNLVQDMTGTGIRLGNSMYAKVTNNTVSNADTTARSVPSVLMPAAAADRVIQGNTISARFAF